MQQHYNDNLFNKKTLRGKLHFARYFWLEDQVKKYSPNVTSVLELGCFDGKTLDYLPKNLSVYDGFDANWGGGLDKAKQSYQNDHTYNFHASSTVSAFSPPQQQYDISICMETLEHLPLKNLEAYVHRLWEYTTEKCYVTIPNEKGIVLLIKYLVKKFILRHVSETYTLRDLLNGFLGRMNKIERIEGGHKGYDYLDTITLLEQYFTIETIDSIPINALPNSLSFTIGLVCTKKAR